ncbi:hypothetical protein R3P38DRAFT_2816041 [Favolaschia claudopus]|uniref:Uncharacterized protein n=1 Tax=Favolaschia claudopus TaxID=2862362 RepID=A0AAV9YZS5_9AGAR
MAEREDSTKDLHEREITVYAQYAGVKIVCPRRQCTSVAKRQGGSRSPSPGLGCALNGYRRHDRVQSATAESEICTPHAQAGSSTGTGFNTTTEAQEEGEESDRNVGNGPWKEARGCIQGCCRRGPNARALRNAHVNKPLGDFAITKRLVSLELSNESSTTFTVDTLETPVAW